MRVQMVMDISGWRETMGPPLWGNHLHWIDGYWPQFWTCPCPVGSFQELTLYSLEGLQTLPNHLFMEFPWQCVLRPHFRHKHHRCILPTGPQGNGGQGFYLLSSLGCLNERSQFTESLQSPIVVSECGRTEVIKTGDADFCGLTV